MGNRLTISYFLMSTIYLFIGCSSAALRPFSSPEMAYETLHHAISINDMELYSKCFLSAEDHQVIERLRASGGFPKTVKVVQHEIVDRQVVNESEVTLTVREIMEHTSSAPADTYFVMSIALAKYQRTLKGWKVYSSATVSIQRVMKVGDRYVPYSDDTQNLK